MRRVPGFVAALAALVALGAAHALAEADDHTHRPALAGIEPAIDGLDLEVRAEPAPTLVVRNRTGAPVDVLDETGAPFLRIGPDHVEADVASPAFFRSESPSPAAAVPPWATGGPPRFVHLVDGADWAWFEHRIAATPVDATWRIPITAGGVGAVITGRWEAIEVPAQVVSTLDPFDVDGLTVEVLPGLAPGLYVRNETEQPLEVDGPRGEPFLRIGPDRTTRATPGGEHEVVAPTPSYAWIDARIGWQGDPPAERASRDWQVPLRLGDRALTLTGTVEWVPIDEPAGNDDGAGAGGVSPLAVAGVIAVSLLLGGWFAFGTKRT